MSKIQTEEEEKITNENKNENKGNLIFYCKF